MTTLLSLRTDVCSGTTMCTPVYIQSNAHEQLMLSKGYVHSWASSSTTMQLSHGEEEESGTRHGPALLFPVLRRGAPAVLLLRLPPQMLRVN